VGSRCTDVKDVVAVWVCIVCTALMRWMVRVGVDEGSKIICKVDGVGGSGLMLSMCLGCTGELAERFWEKRRHEKIVGSWGIGVIREMGGSWCVGW